jgi:hypothetical protein
MTQQKHIFYPWETPPMPPKMHSASLLLARVVPRTFSIKKQLNDKLHDRP